MSTAQDVLNQVRHAINPETDVFGVLNEAIRAVAKRLFFLKSSILHDELDIDIIADDEYGALPSDFWGLVSFPYFSGYTWHLKPLPSLAVKISFTGTGIPLYYEIKGAYIYLTPASGGTYTIVGDYFAKPTKITTVSATMPFYELFDDIIASYMEAYFTNAGKGIGGTILSPTYLHGEIDLIATSWGKKAPYHSSGGINWGPCKMASTITAQEIIDDTEALLQDSDNVRWTAAEHLLAVNNGSKEICSFKPDAYVVGESKVLVAGVIQSLPSGGFQLQDVTHNMGVSPGSTPGKAIRLINEKVMDAMNPNWRSATASATVDYYMYDERKPLYFSVSPPQPSSAFGYVYLYCSKVPADIAASAVILVPDIYRGVLLDYVLYCAYRKDAEQPENAQRATLHYQAFLNALGERRNVEKIEDPNAY